MRNTLGKRKTNKKPNKKTVGEGTGRHRKKKKEG